MKRASYKEGIEYIALNDEPSELDTENVKGYISVQLLAALFHKDPEAVAKAVVNYRIKHTVSEND